MTATIDNIIEIQKTINLSKVELSARNEISNFLNLATMAQKDIGIKEWCAHSKPFENTCINAIKLINVLIAEKKISFQNFVTV